jgi:hypothetical protein
LLLAVGWLLLQFTECVRQSALEGTPLHDILTTTPDGNTSVTLPFPLILSSVAAFLLVMLTHELVHGLFYWRFAGQRPGLGIKGSYVYVAAPPGVYFPRKQCLIVGVAPFVLLTLLGWLLITIAPVIALPTLIFFVAFNAAGAAGDVLMSACLLSYFIGYIDAGWWHECDCVWAGEKPESGVGPRVANRLCQACDAEVLLGDRGRTA